MPEASKKTVTIWRAILDGDCKLIHKSELQLLKELTHRCAWYEPGDHHRWDFKSEVVEVPVTIGEAHDWSAEGGSGGVHIHWLCPHCGEAHYTDEDPDDCSPFLWFCEHGEGVVLVSVDGY